MEKTKTIIQTILILVIWYCFYSVGGWKSLGSFTSVRIICPSNDTDRHCAKWLYMYMQY